MKGVGLVLVAAALLAQSHSALSQMSAAEAFGLGKSSGDAAHTQGVFDSIGHTKGAEVLSGYSTTPPSQSSYWSGDQTPLLGLTSNGSGKITECGSTGLTASDPAYKQHCEAVDAIAKQPGIKPTGLLTYSDPLILKGKSITADPAAITGAIDGSYSNCTTSTTENPASFSMETCEDWSEQNAESCTMGQEVVVDPDYIYSCLETLKTINASTCTYGAVVQVDVDYNYQCHINKEVETLKCNRTYSATCTGGGYGCAPAGIKTDTVTISGFGNFLVHPAAGGYWYVSTGTITPSGGWVNNYMFDGSYHRVFTSTTSFQIVGKDTISSFVLNDLMWDDNIMVWLNGHLVFTSVAGATQMTMGCSIYNWSTGQNEYVSNAIWTGSQCRQNLYEGGSAINNYGGAELKSYLNEGLNTVVIKVAIGKNGDAIARFKTLASCPTNCTVNGINECTTLEERAK